MSDVKFTSLFGNYPKEYNRAVHGPYYPWVNYGTPEQPLSEVKLGELKSWFMKRDKTPQAIIAACSRNFTKWHVNWMGTRNGPPSKAVFQLLFFYSLSSMFSMYGLLREHRNHKYHW